MIEIISRFKTEAAHHQLENAKLTEDKIVQKINEKISSAEELILYEEICAENLLSAKIIISFWKYLIKSGEIRKSKNIFLKAYEILSKRKNQSNLEELLHEAKLNYSDEELKVPQFNLFLIQGSVEKVDSMITESLINEKSIKLISRNIKFWALNSKKLRTTLFDYHSRNNPWMYKTVLKLMFEKILHEGISNQEVNFLKDINVSNVDHEAFQDMEEVEMTDQKKIENQIKLMLKIGKKSKAIEICHKIEDENFKTKMKKLVGLKNEVVKNIERVSEISEIEKTPAFLRSTIDKIQAEMVGGSEIEKNISFLNFCLASDLYEKALETIDILLEKLEDETDKINLRFTKVQIYYLSNLKTQAILEINDLLTNAPLSNEEKKLSDWYLKKIFGELNAR
ncbi:MAG: hypothetical protein Fur0010_02480 [Bdellovibrio sp.]